MNPSPPLHTDFIIVPDCFEEGKLGEGIESEFRTMIVTDDTIPYNNLLLINPLSKQARFEVLQRMT